MNPQIDKLIADIDAVINGEAPGAVGSGVTDAELDEIEMHCVWDKPGRPFTIWRD